MVIYLSINREIKSEGVFSTFDATRIAYKIRYVKIRRNLDKPHILCGPVFKDKHWCLFMVNINISELFTLIPKVVTMKQGVRFLKARVILQ